MSRHNESPVKVGMGCHLSFFYFKRFCAQIFKFPHNRTVAGRHSDIYLEKWKIAIDKHP